MIILYEKSINQVFVTLTEKKSDATTTYLFEFTNNTSGESFYCVAIDNSTSPIRYNSFCITHKADSIDSMNGEVDFTLPGFYTYNIYENPDLLLSPVALNLVETGKMKFVTETEAVTVFANPVSPNHVVFNPDDYSTQS